jgi:hypothetical protein
MKTIKAFTILVLSLSATLLFADNDTNYLAYNNTRTASKLMVVSWSPVVPKAADFEEVNLSFTIPFPASLYDKVAPALPRYADFDDDVLPVHLGKLVPVLPMEADF